jgi:hypothetical protein
VRQIRVLIFGAALMCSGSALAWPQGAATGVGGTSIFATLQASGTPTAGITEQGNSGGNDSQDVDGSEEEGGAENRDRSGGGNHDHSNGSGNGGGGKVDGSEEQGGSEN